MLNCVSRLGAVVACLSSCLLLMFGWYRLEHAQSPNFCEMTYMRPSYVHVPVAQWDERASCGLYLYRERWQRNFGSIASLAGRPLLFIPGNGGSYQQVRAVSSFSERVIRFVQEQVHKQLLLAAPNDLKKRASHLRCCSVAANTDGWGLNEMKTTHRVAA